MASQSPVVFLEGEGATPEWLKSELEGAGFTVTVARDGPAALDLIRCQSPVLLVLYSPPGAGAPWPVVAELCEFLRRVRRGNGIAVIVLTHGCGDELLADLLDAGADDCLALPCSRPEWLARVRAVLRRTRSTGGG